MVEPLTQEKGSMMTKLVNFTKSKLDNLPTPNNGKRTYYRDTQINSLSLAVQVSGAKSFYVVKKIEGKTEKIFIGKYPDLSVENARKKAVIILGEIALGNNPQADKQRIRSEMTLGELFEQYMTRYSKVEKKTWLADQRDIPRFCGKWFSKRISQISRHDIQRLQETIRAERGLYMANAILMRLRAVFNKAIEWGWEGRNPTIGLKKYRQKSRDRFIQPSEMPHILRAINEEPLKTSRDFFWMLLLTGARKTNTMMMRWQEINWDRAEWRIPDSKNGETLFITLPNKAIEILRARQKVACGEWVFPHPLNEERHFVNFANNWEEIKKRATSYLQEQNEHGVASLMDIRMHDIRRTFGSYQAMGGASLQVIGKSLGHKSTQSTQIYARLNLDVVRDSVVRATDFMIGYDNH